MAVRPVPSIPSVTCSAVDDDENPEDPFLLNGHIFCTHTHSLFLTLTQLSDAPPPETEIHIQVNNQSGFFSLIRKINKKSTTKEENLYFTKKE